jgi:amicyanin
MPCISAARFGRALTAVAIIALAPAIAAAEPVQVSIADMAYGPDAITIHAGDSVVWTNNEVMPHTVTFKDHSPSSRLMQRGQTFTRVFDQPGTYEYFCAIHPKMVARVVVTAQ